MSPPAPNPDGETVHVSIDERTGWVVEQVYRPNLECQEKAIRLLLEAPASTASVGKRGVTPHLVDLERAI